MKWLKFFITLIILIVSLCSCVTEKKQVDELTLAISQRHFPVAFLAEQKIIVNTPEKKMILQSQVLHQSNRTKILLLDAATKIPIVSMQGNEKKTDVHWFREVPMAAQNNIENLFKLIREIFLLGVDGKESQAHPHIEALKTLKFKESIGIPPCNASKIVDLSYGNVPVDIIVNVETFYIKCLKNQDL